MSPRRVRHTLRGFAPWVLLKGTISVCMRYRVTGLAAEGAFFAVLSLPPLVFGLAGSIGYVIGIFGAETVEGVKQQLVDLARQALTEDSVQRVIIPTLDAVLDQGRADIISIGFILALWSGSRALNVFIDTISIMYGMGGRRGIVKTRALSFTMYVIVLAAGVVVVPLVLAGPALVDHVLPPNLDFLNALYWPAVVLSTSLFLTTLYHLAVPERTPWRHDLAGAFLALALWVAGSYLLRYVLAESIGGTSIYGPLAAPIAVLLWLYLIVLSLLVGAAFNASLDQWLSRRRRSAEARNVPETHPDTRHEPNAGHDQDAEDADRDGAEVLGRVPIGPGLDQTDQETEPELEREPEPLVEQPPAEEPEQQPAQEAEPLVELQPAQEAAHEAEQQPAPYDEPLPFEETHTGRGQS